MIIFKEKTRPLMEMANMRGKHVKTDNIGFSFYFSDKTECNHGLRVKVSWNSEKLTGGFDGYFELRGPLRYISGIHSKTPPAKDFLDAKRFFKKYKVLFAAVWELKLDPQVIQDYFRAFIDINELVTSFENVTEEQNTLLSQATDLISLEKIVREHNIFNMND